MHELIVVNQMTIGDSEVNAVDGRELHDFLEVKTDFRHWITRRINEYGFEENVDWRSKMTAFESGQEAKDYTLSLDMAKELSMVEKNEKGRQARKYFIECEKRLKASPNASLEAMMDAKLADMQNQIAMLAREAQKRKFKAIKKPLEAGYHRIGALAKEIGLTTKELSEDLISMGFMHTGKGSYRFGHTPTCNLFRYVGKNHDILLFHKLVLQDVLRFRETGKRQRSKYHTIHYVGSIENSGTQGLKEPNDPIFE